MKINYDEIHSIFNINGLKDIFFDYLSIIEKKYIFNEPISDKVNRCFYFLKKY